MMYQLSTLTMDPQTAMRDVIVGGHTGEMTSSSEPFLSAELHNAMLELAELFESCELEPQPTFSW